MIDAKDLPAPDKCPICNGAWTSHRNRIQMCSRYHDERKKVARLEELLESCSARNATDADRIAELEEQVEQLEKYKAIGQAVEELEKFAYTFGLSYSCQRLYGLTLRYLVKPNDPMSLIIGKLNPNLADAICDVLEQAKGEGS